MARTRTPDEEKVVELQNLAKVLGFKISNVKIDTQENGETRYYWDYNKISQDAERKVCLA